MTKELKNILEKVFHYLNRRGLSLGTAESCTGGMISSHLTDLSGISTVFKGGYIVYSNDLKEKLLGVNPETLKEFGAVSNECATEMVNGLCRNLNVDAGIAVTGIAGPDGGTSEKPVGLVYIAVKLHNKTEVKEFLFKGKRKDIRNQATLQAFKMLHQTIIENRGRIIH